MNEKSIVPCILTATVLLLGNTLFVLLPMNVSGSYPSPRMEIDNANQWTQKAGLAGDNRIDLKITTKYVSKINPNNRILPGAYYEVIDTSDLSVIGTGFTGADGVSHVFPGVPNQDHKDIKLNIYMGKPDGGVCGKIVNSNGEIYYGVSNTFACSEDKDYDCLITFKDSGDGGNSFVGAAAIYATVYYSRAIFVNNINDNDQGNGDIRVAFNWPAQCESKFIPKSGQNPSKVEIDGNWFEDDDATGWNIGYDSVRHQHAHLLHYEIGYEESFWPGGTPMPPSGGWHVEIQTLGASSELEWAFADGFANFWAARSDAIDNQLQLSNDLVYNMDQPLNGEHIETDSWNSWRFIGAQTPTGVRGERTVGRIANLLWDVLDSNTFPDLMPNVDDDEISISLNNFWTIMNTNTVSSILAHWDHTLYQPFFPNVADLVKLEYIYLNNNVGRYQYAQYLNGFETDDDLEFSYFEIRGMNPLPPQSDQRILGRYVLWNIGDSRVTFDNNMGCDISYSDPNANNGAFGTSYRSASLDEDHKIVVTGVKDVDFQVIQSDDWYFWPHYKLDNGHQAATVNDNIAKVVELKDQIWSETFQAAWPGVWTTGENTQANPTYLWDRVTFPGPGGGVNLCPWCAGIDSNGNSRDPQQQPFLMYMDDQATYIYTEKNWRYIGLRVHWDMWLDVAPQNLNDKIIFRTYDGANSINVANYDKNSNTNWNWKGFWTNMPSIAFKNGENTRLEWYFVSDKDGIVARGAMIDEIYLNVDNRP